MAVPAALKQQPDTTPLLAYQQAAIDKLAARGGSGGLFMDMGTGKTRAALELAWRLGARRLLVVVPLSVVGVWRREADRWWPASSVLNLGHGAIKRRALALTTLLDNGVIPAPLLVVVNYEAYWREPLKSVLLRYAPDMVVYDECFPSDTIIATPEGNRPIAEIRQGDWVWGYDHDVGAVVPTQVLTCFQRQTGEPLIALDSLEATPNHPVWTNELGYIPISTLDTVSYTGLKLVCEGTAMRVVQAAFCAKGIVHQSEEGTVLRDELLGQVANAPAGGKSPSLQRPCAGSAPVNYEETSGASRRTVKTEAASRGANQPFTQSRSGEEGILGSLSQRSAEARGERETATNTPATAGGPSGVANGGCAELQTPSPWTPYLLQDRHREQNQDDSSRGGWVVPFPPQDAGGGQTKGNLPEIARVDSAAFYEPASYRELGAGGADHTVYNLETETGNYFAGGWLVHNCHRLKGRSTRQARFAHYLADKVRWRVGLTGTPMASGPEDLFSLYKALDPRIFGTRWLDYERAYIVKGGYGGYQILGYRNRAVLEERLAESSYRITKAEALDLPPQVDVMVPVPLTSRRVYDELRRRAIAEINGLAGESGTALSRCVLTNLLRLQQVTSGFVKVTDGREVELSTEKHDALADLLADAVPAVGRVVVFARFRHDIRVAARAAWGVVGDHAVYTMTGDTPQRQREGIIEDFLSSDRAVLVLQIAVGSLGIDLSRACVAIFYSPDYSLVNFLQARDRLHRLGQEQKVTYYHLVAEGTVDEAIYNSLAAKQDLTRSILDRASAAKIFA